MLVAASWPWAVWISKVDLDLKYFSSLLMKRHLFSTIIGHCLSQASGNMSQSSGKGLKCRVGISSIHSGHQPVSALSLDQSANCALISCSLDQIPLPVTWHLPIFHFSWPVMDTRHIGNLISTLISTASRASALFPLAERFNQLLAQFTFWKRIECNIDRLMRDLFWRDD